MKTIPYHELPLVGPKIKTRAVSEFTHKDGRQIIVREIQECPDFLVIITRPIDDETQSELIFRLSPEGSVALAMCLFKAIQSQESKTNET